MNGIRPAHGRSALFALAGAGLALAAVSCVQQPPASDALPPRAQDPVEHGAYIVRTSGCEHCHTPGALYGLPDPDRRLAGSDLGWKGVWGVRYPSNLTPDPETGIGAWSVDEIVHAIRLAQRPDHTPIRGAMPWFHFVYFSEEDARAIALYLKSLPPVPHRVPDRAEPGEAAHGVYVEIPSSPPAWDAPRVP